MVSNDKGPLGESRNEEEGEIPETCLLLPRLVLDSYPEGASLPKNC